MSARKVHSARRRASGHDGRRKWSIIPRCFKSMSHSQLRRCVGYGFKQVSGFMVVS